MVDIIGTLQKKNDFMNYESVNLEENNNSKQIEYGRSIFMGHAYGQSNCVQSPVLWS